MGHILLGKHELIKIPHAFDFTKDQRIVTEADYSFLGLNKMRLDNITQNILVGDIGPQVPAANNTVNFFGATSQNHVTSVEYLNEAETSAIVTTSENMLSFPAENSQVNFRDKDELEVNNSGGHVCDFVQMGSLEQVAGSSRVHLFVQCVLLAGSYTNVRVDVVGSNDKVRWFSLPDEYGDELFDLDLDFTADVFTSARYVSYRIKNLQENDYIRIHGIFREESKH